MIKKQRRIRWGNPDQLYPEWNRYGISWLYHTSPFANENCNEHQAMEKRIAMPYWANCSCAMTCSKLFDEQLYTHFLTWTKRCSPVRRIWVMFLFNAYSFIGELKTSREGSVLWMTLLKIQDGHPILNMNPIRVGSAGLGNIRQGIEFGK